MEIDAHQQLIATDRISESVPYSFRFRAQDENLDASLKKRGILFPLLLVRSVRDERLVVSGNRRLSYARRHNQTDVPCIFLEERLSEKELFLLSLYSNWNQRVSELDRMVAIGKAEGVFGFSREEILGEVCPALGIASDRGLVDEYRKTGKLIPEIHQLIAGGSLPFRGAAKLSSFTGEEQCRLALEFFGQAHFTANQLSLCSEWLSDLKKIKKSSVGPLLQEERVQRWTRNPKLDPRARGEGLFQAVRALRFPRITEVERRFGALKSRVEALGEILLEAPQSFESEGVILRARIRNKAGLERALRFLAGFSDWDGFLD